MKAFDINVDGKILDYRKSEVLNINDIKKNFEKKYKVKKIWQGGRHVLGALQKDNTNVFLKLSTTQGVGAVTQIDYNWNRQFNDIVSRNTDFWVPQNIEKGLYKNKLFYMIIEYFNGKLYAKRPKKGKVERILKQDLGKIIEFSEVIQNLNIDPLSVKDKQNYQEYFLEKTKSWFNAVPKKIIKEYKVNQVFELAEKGYNKLERKTRHGDFTPWHIIKLPNGKVGLIDGEHAMRNGVEYYDIGYLIQRIYSVLENPQFAKELFELLIKRNYDLEKLKVILASRAIGGFCDESLISKNPNFPRANKFGQWVLGL